MPPTAAIAAVATQAIPTLQVDQLEREIEREFALEHADARELGVERELRIERDRSFDRERGRDRELVPTVPNDRLVPADFSEQVALTSPIRLPKPRT